jgi:hypothetical protein
MPILSASRKLLKRRWLRWGIILLLGYTIFGFLILPLIVRAVAVKQLSKQLDREVSIRKVRINPYALSGSIQGMLIKDKDGEPFVSWDEIYGNFQLSSFFGKAWVFKEVHASKPFIRVQINKDYTFNFSDLLKKFAADPSVPSKPSKPLVLRIDSFHIAGAQARVTDLTPPTPFHRVIGPLEITLTGFHTDPNSRNPYAFEGTTDAGEHFSWNGYFSLDPLRSAGEISFDGFSLSKYSPLYQDLVRFEIRDGVVGFRAAYDVSQNGTNWFGTVSNAEVHLKNFRTAEKSATNNLLEVDSLAVEGARADASARTANIAMVRVDGARLAAKRDRSGDLNLATISQSAEGVNTPGGILLLLQAATNAVAMLMNTTNLWSATLDDLQVTNCALAWEDAATRRPVRALVDQLAVSGKHLSNIPGSNQTANVLLRWNTNGLVQLQAEAQIDPPVANATIQVTNVDLQPIDPYLEPFVNVYIRRSKLAIDGRLQMRIQSNSLPEASFTGSVLMNDFSSVDGFAGNDLLKWSSLGLNDISAALNPPNIAVKAIALIDPVAHIVIETNSQLNVLAVLRAGETNDAAPAPAPAAIEPKPAAKTGMSARFGGMLRQVLDANTNAGTGGLPAINVDRVSISNGIVQFEDRSIQPPAHTSIDSLNGTVSGFSSSNLKRADVSFSGKVSRTGPFEITGRINPLSTNAATELLLKLNDVDLRPGSPYSGKFLGYRLNRGFLTLGVNYHVVDRKLMASNVVIVDHLTLGEKVESSDATKLPVRLAVALLKDRNGRILIDVPIDGNLDDPNFHLGRVIGHVIGNVITRLVTSPFAALGSVFGGKGEDVSFIDFEPGRADSAPNAEPKLETLLHGLDERPGLQLEISGGFDPATDGAAIRQVKLEQELRRHRWTLLKKSVQAQMKIEDVQLTDADRTDALNALYQAMSKTNSQVLQPVAAGSQPKVRPQPSNTAKTDSAKLDHGAELLVRSAAAQGRTQPVDAIELQLLAVMPVSETELRKLASARAGFMQRKLKDSGKITPDRLILAEQDAVSTNQAARVFFNLR